MERSLGICTRYKSIENLNYEKRALVEEAKKLYDVVILIDTRQVTYQFIRGETQPIVIHDGQNISNLNSLHVRTTAHREASTSLLVHSLKLCGCDVFDPIERFSIGYASKLLSTLERFEQRVGSSSFFAFEYKNALCLLQELYEKKLFPLIVKPIAGKQGKGIQVLQDLNLANNYVEQFFSILDRNQDEPLFLQTYESFVEEYRVFIVDGVVLGMVKKFSQKGTVPANAAQGATFIKVDNPDLVKFLLPHTSKNGVLGVDVAIDLSGKFHIIEKNWAPSWRVFETVTGINVAKLIVQRSFERLSK